jgi:hypothetical protein
VLPDEVGPVVAVLVLLAALVVMSFLPAVRVIEATAARELLGDRARRAAVGLVGGAPALRELGIPVGFARGWAGTGFAACASASPSFVDR